MIFGPALPLLLVSSASGPCPSADSTAKESCRENTARYKVPEYVSFVGEYPTTASRKIQKYKLREAAVERHGLEAAGGGYRLVSGAHVDGRLIGDVCEVIATLE